MPWQPGTSCSRPAAGEKDVGGREACPEDAVVHRSRCVSEEAAVVDVRQTHTGIPDSPGRQASKSTCASITGENSVLSSRSATDSREQIRERVPKQRLDAQASMPSLRAEG